MAHREELAYLMENVLPRLKPRDAQRVQALAEADGDRGAAAQALGMTHEQFSHIWRQTTFPNVKQVLADLFDKEE